MIEQGSPMACAAQGEVKRASFLLEEKRRSAFYPVNQDQYNAFHKSIIVIHSTQNKMNKTTLDGCVERRHDIKSKIRPR